MPSPYKLEDDVLRADETAELCALHLSILLKMTFLVNRTEVEANVTTL
jgi:hypothetical protein